MNIDKFFIHTSFVAAANNLEQMPSYNKPSVAFAGRSNVGKSSLINTLTNQYNLCKTSKKPGCTQTINFFEIKNKMHLIDLPGYGYAQRSKSLRQWWKKTVINYLQQCPNLKCVFVLINALHGIKNNDLEFINTLDKLAIFYRIILTKSDKISQLKQKYILEHMTKLSKSHPAMYPHIILASSKTQQGINEIRKIIIDIHNNIIK